MEVERHAQTLGTGAWEEIIAPIDCDYYTISSPSAQTFWKCSDKNVAGSCVQFDPPGWFSLVAPFMATVFGATRWKAGEHITYVKSSAPLDLYFLR